MIVAPLLFVLAWSGEVTEISNPAEEGSRCPGLVRGADGRAYLTWTRPTDAGHALGVAVLGAQGWERRADAASGADWFVNWADFPALAALEDGTLAASFLVKSASGPYTYDVHLALSGDGGASWGEPFVLHEDRRPAEHGFVSLLALDEARFGAVWLDGRETGGGHANGGEGGAMTLRARTIARDGALGAEVLVDPRVCDCCQTAAVRAADGSVLVAWRDRTDTEVRDVTVATWSGDEVGGLRPLHDDGWKVAGCPVNGPALDAHEQRVGAAWFTMGADGAEGPGRVRVSFSDGGADFGTPLELPVRRPLGRVDAVFDASGALWVTWFEAVGDLGRWRLCRVGPKGELGAARDVVDVPSPGRDAGFGRLLADGERLLFAWTMPGPTPSVHTTSIPIGP